MKNNKQNLIVTLMIIALVGVLSISAAAAPPSNDNFANADPIAANGFPYTAFFTASNVEATVEPGEPNILNRGAGKSVWFKWTSPIGSRPVQISLQRSDFHTLVGVYQGTSVNNLVTVGFGTKSLTFSPSGNATYYIKIDGYENDNPSSGSIGFDFGSVIGRQSIDFDFDGRSDFAVFRPSTGTWYARASSDGRLIAQNWGTQGDIPVAGDFTNSSWGGTATDFAVFRPSTGMWYIRHDHDSEPPIYAPFGLPGDVPVTADVLGGSGAEYGVFRPSTGEWYFQDTAGGLVIKQWGLAGDIPVLGDFDFDRITDIAVFRPSEGNWYIDSTSYGVKIIHWGQQGDLPVRGDFDGDGRNDPAVFRPSEGKWYILRSGNGQVQTRYWGKAGDKPVSGDFDGDGRYDFAVFRPSDSTWYVSYNGGGGDPIIIKWGTDGDVPITGNYY
jgi:hypothetical protein